jgi:hypothetical protein
MRGMDAANAHGVLASYGRTLAPQRYERLLAGQLRIEQRLEQVAEYMCHLGSPAQPLQDRDIVQKSSYGSDN